MKMFWENCKYWKILEVDEHLLVDVKFYLDIHLFVAAVRWVVGKDRIEWTIIGATHNKSDIVIK